MCLFRRTIRRTIAARQPINPAAEGLDQCGGEGYIFNHPRLAGPGPRLPLPAHGVGGLIIELLKGWPRTSRPFDFLT